MPSDKLLYSKKMVTRQTRTDWQNVEDVEQEVAHFITKLTCVYPNLTDEELYIENI